MYLIFVKVAEKWIPAFSTVHREHVEKLLEGIVQSRVQYVSVGSSNPDAVRQSVEMTLVMKDGKWIHPFGWESADSTIYRS